MMVISMFSVMRGEDEGVNGASPTPGSASSTNWPAWKGKTYRSDMAALSFGLLALLGFLGAAWWFSRMKTEKAAKLVRYLLAGGAITAGVLLSLRGAPVLGGPIGLMGPGLLILGGLAALAWGLLRPVVMPRSAME